MTDEKVKYINRQIGEALKNEKNCCTKGCSFCCHQQIEIINIEKKLIREYIIKKTSDKQKKIIKENLKTWLDFFDENTPDNRILDGNDIFKDFGEKVAGKGLKCPLLINNLCSIYEMRPITCRIHYVEHSPELCDKDKLRDSAFKGMSLRNYVINMLKNVEEINVEPLANVISDIFLPERKLKPMKKIIVR
ncbi:YkgJ family cysteine cluster protein [Formosa sp. 3Alg 14/1]|uniref:YkgJ family cysteine cluster protein n=1 Tax=Formosa sp. 3Alg 14/1 TaxID=3382190 RepID=UPI0039BE08EE